MFKEAWRLAINFYPCGTASPVTGFTLLLLVKMAKRGDLTSMKT